MKERNHRQWNGLLVVALLTGLAVSLALPVRNLDAQDEKWLGNWHQFRGPLATGSVPDAKPPIEWDEETNLRWKTEIPGEGSSTPIIWENKLFVLTAVKTDRVDESLPAPEDQPQRPFNIKYPNAFYDFQVLCLDRGTGEVLWQQTATTEVPSEGVHPDNDFASASPTTDGERLYVPFGSQGYYCYDLAGKLLWERDLGDVETRLSFGEGASLTVHGNALIVVRDNEGQSKVTVLDANSGETLWERDRDEPTAWATPLVVENKGQTQVITSASNRVRSYDLSNGELLWECGGQVANVTPSPVLQDDQVICMSGYRGSAAVSMPLDASGDISETDKVAWKLERGTPYISSPVLYNGRLYFNQSLNNVLSCLDATSGEVLYGPERVDEMGRLYASPVAANGHIYFVDREGTTFVFHENQDTFEPVAVNRIDDPMDASPAIVGDAIYLRGKRFVYCFGE